MRSMPPTESSNGPANTDKLVGNSKLPGRMRDDIRRRHYSISTEQAHLDWARYYILYHDKRHPNDLAEVEITTFLNHLAVERNVTALPRNQALNALLFLYKQTLGREEVHLNNLTHAKRPERLPSVFERDEVARLIGQLEGTHKLIASLL